MVAAVVAAPPTAALTCGGRLLSFAKQVAAATYVVRVRVTGGATPLWSGTVVTAFRGCMPRTLKLRTGWGPWRAKLQADTDYIFLWSTPPVEGEHFVRGRCSRLYPWSLLTAEQLQALEGAPLDLVCPAGKRTPGYFTVGEHATRAD